MATEEKISNKVTFEVASLPVRQVTVYLDRAEVCRSLEASLKPGLNEVILSKITSAIDKESVRVEGQGNAVITDVSYNEQRIQEAEAETVTVKQLREKAESLKKQQRQLQNTLNRFNKQRAVLEGISDSVSSHRPPGFYNQNSAHDSKDSTNILAVIGIDGVSKFLEFYGERAAKLDIEIAEVSEKLTALNEELFVVEENRRKLTSNNAAISREVSIFLESEKGGDAKLDVSYVVFRASWLPQYDIRVFTEDDTMKINYFGLIKQNTGEDWKETSICLSTAVPSIGGTIPVLGTQKLFLYKPPRPPSSNERGFQTRMSLAKNALFGGSGRESESLSLDQGESVLYCGAEPPTMAMAEVSLAEAEVTSNPITTTFDIARKASIPSDNTEHKVSVALIDLKPEFSYETVPSKSAHAFLKAKVKNNSAYALLSGATSVFVNNNFIAKSSLQAVSPQEEFTCSLGVDPSIRVTYKPARKFTEESGLLSKIVHQTTEQTVELKNTRTFPAKISVLEHMPLSTEEKIKVTLLEPQVPKEKEKGVGGPLRIDKHSNLVWDVEIPASESKELKVKYVVEYPRGETLEFFEET